MTDRKRDNAAGSSSANGPKKETAPKRVKPAYSADDRGKKPVRPAPAEKRPRREAVVSPAERDKERQLRQRSQSGKKVKPSALSATDSNPLIPTIDDDDVFFGEGTSSEFDIKKGKKPVSAIKIILAILLVALLAWGGTLGCSAFKAKDAAVAVIQELSAAKKAVAAKDYDAALAVVDDMTANAAVLNKEVSGPQWAIATFIPVLGDDVKAVRTLAGVLDELSTEVLTPVAEVVKDHPIDQMLTSDGVDGEGVAQLCEVVGKTSTLMQEASNKLQKLPPLHIDKLKTRIEPMVEMFDEVNGLYQLVSDYAPVVRGLMGIDGARSYLIVAQNSAEIRASGGFPGAMGILSVNNGAIDMGEFGTPYDLMVDYYPDTVASLEGAEQGLFYKWAYVYPRDVGYNPDFEYDAKVWAAAYEAQMGTHVDGVISVAPAVVQRVLALTGGITLSDGTEMTGENATKVLQSDIYWDYLAKDTKRSGSNDYTDKLFAETAQKAFKKLMGGLNLKKAKGFMELVIESAQKREIMMYFANAEEQAVVKSMGYSGSMNANAAEPELGVFFSVCNPSKLGWYVDVDTTIGEAKTNSDGTKSYEVTAVFTSILTEDDVEAAGKAIVGDYDGNMAPFIHLVAPAGGSINNFVGDLPEQVERDDGNVATWEESTLSGLNVTYLKYASLMPGQRITCTFTVTTAKDAEPLKLVTTPTLTEYR